MPAKYDAIKAKLLAKGFTEDDAQKHAAMIFNGTRPAGVKPVTGNNYDKKKSK